MIRSVSRSWNGRKHGIRRQSEPVPDGSGHLRCHDAIIFPSANVLQFRDIWGRRQRRYRCARQGPFAGHSPASTPAGEWLSAQARPASRAAVYEGTEVTDIAEARPQPTASGNGFDLNFENTPVATVAKVVLGDILGTGYTIDPRVQGTVSLVSVQPVAKSDIVFVLENALRLSGVVLLRDTAGYRLTPLGDAVGSGRVDAAASSPEPGFGVSVVPLQ